MRKSTLVVMCVIDELTPELSKHLQDVLQDSCPVEIIINGRKLRVITATSIDILTEVLP